jgi:subtilisin family serine protease
LASYLPGKLVGSAPFASYSIFRTEDSRRETLVEEDNYVAAAEYADSIGVDVISVSLGYNTGFEDISFDYVPTDLDGNTSFISRGAKMAARKGILVVNSAGNEGQNTNWGGLLTMPADADSICTIGAIRPDGSYASFSSRGPTADGRIKPDLVFQGGPAYISNGFGESVAGTGTSYAAPVGAGLLTCLWQAFPDSSAQQIIAMAKRCADQADAPENRRGWGLPNFECAFLSASKNPGDQPFPRAEQTTLNLSPNPTGGPLNIWFYAPTAADYSLSLTDAAGRILGQFKFSAIEKEYVTRNVDVSEFATGFYFAVLEGGGQSIRAKIIRQGGQ